MPFTLLLTRGCPFASGSIRDALASSAEADVTPGELEGLLSELPVSAAPDGASLVRFPDTDLPWFSAAPISPGGAALCVSYTHSGFDRCCAALIAFAVELADVAEARVFDATQQLTRELADELVDPESAYMAREFQRRIEILEQMENAGGAPLEYPLGLHDWVDDYFRFHVPVGSLRGSRARMTERLEASLRAQDDAWFRTVSDGAYLLGRTGDDAGLTRVLLADDGYVQVWPRYGMVPFSVPAGLTLSVARRVADAVGHGQLEFYGRNVDDALLSELTTRAKGHGLDLYLWMIDTWPSSSNP